MARSVVDNRINSMKVKGIIQQVFGWPIAVIFGMTAIYSSVTIKDSSDVSAFIICTVFTLGAVLLIVLGLKKFILIKTFRNYSARLTADPMKSLDSLASSMGVSVAVVRKKISAMLNHGLFPNAYIDKQTNCLVTVQCRGCGATNKIAKGSVAECEFCGSQISM